MKKLLLPVAALAMLMLPAAADAAQCRSSETGKFAKCGAPGSVPAAQYVPKTKSMAKSKSSKKMAAAMPMMAAPAATPTKSGFMGMMKPKAKPAMMGAKAARCKDAKSKFVKCGTPGAKPA